MSTQATLCIEHPDALGVETRISFSHDGYPEAIFPFVDRYLDALLQGDEHAIQMGWRELMGPNSSPLVVDKGLEPIKENAYNFDLGGAYVYELDGSSFAVRKPGDESPIDPYCQLLSIYPRYQEQEAATITKAIESIEAKGIEVINPGSQVYLELPIDLARSDYDRSDIHFAEFKLQLGAPVFSAEGDRLNDAQVNTAIKRFAMQGEGPAFGNERGSEENLGVKSPYQTGEIFEGEQGLAVAKITYHFPRRDSQAVFYSQPFDPSLVNEARDFAIKQGLQHIDLDSKRGSLTFTNDQLSGSVGLKRVVYDAEPGFSKKEPLIARGIQSLQSQDLSL